MEEPSRSPRKTLACVGCAWVTCVPCVVAARPGQIPGEGEIQVENPPGQDNNVIEVQECDDDLGTITKAFKDKRTGQHIASQKS